MDTLALDQDQDWTSNWASNLTPQPQTVTVTLTQTEESSEYTSLLSELPVFRWSID